MIVINGAGIAGLTLANSLQRAGVEYVLIEQAKIFSATGAGIILQNNGLAALNYIGLAGHIHGQWIEKMELGYEGIVQSTSIKNSSLQAMCVERSELQRVLTLNIPSQNIIFDANISDIKEQDEKVTIYLSNGQYLVADYLVNAAGIHSNLHSTAEIQETNQWCWRAIVKLNSPLQSSGEYWFGEQRFGIAPLPDSKAYLFHVIDTDQYGSVKTLKDEVREKWILDKVAKLGFCHYLDFGSTDWLSHPLSQRVINWGSERVVAIGDAAHAMTPNLGQGAVIAMEDAIELSLLIKSKEAGIAKKIKNKRHKRVSKVQKQSLIMGKIAHSKARPLKFFRARLLKFLPLNMMLKYQVRWMNVFVNKLG